ncbi:MAG TPA: hypothetical protein PKE63_00600 [Lacibacter sp.]|nr:hypothetical protein [Lacibacter sp.]HMO90072.1 hypothetical protein [Lacibacter sp.]HMP85741.1 hypothetical protein [Lacibacter sp.]
MKKFLITSAFALSLLLSFTNAVAGEGTPAPELKAAGRINKQPVYQLRLNNSTAASYYLLVKDEFGVVLHEETLSGSNITRNYQLNTLELGATPVIFEVYNMAGLLTGSIRVDVATNQVANARIK